MESLFVQLSDDVYCKSQFQKMNPYDGFVVQDHICPVCIKLYNIIPAILWWSICAVVVGFLLVFVSCFVGVLACVIYSQQFVLVIALLSK